MEQPKTPTIALVQEAMNASRQVCDNLPAALIAAHVLNELGYRCADGRYGVCLGPHGEDGHPSFECDLLLVEGQLVDGSGFVYKDRDAVLAHVRTSNPAADWAPPWKDGLQSYDPFDPDWLDKEQTAKVPEATKRALALMEHQILSAGSAQAPRPSRMPGRL